MRQKNTRIVRFSKRFAYSQMTLQKADKAKRMLMAIDHNCGGKLAASGEAPADHNMPAALCAKPMMVKVQVWEINDKKGNWISSVAARDSGPQRVEQAPTMDANAKGDDIPF